MEFLLINHPLDCPICDQGGECQLQDLAVGYGGSSSRYTEPKRVVFHKDLGPLISAEEMTRCIQCTRCVRFGQEIAGVMELGMIGRGEHSEIVAFVGKTVDSELSGNSIDVCPVGALTSKPFRYAARTWELARRKSVSPHDSLGSNLIVQVKGDRVMRVLPLENEAVNECWISDKDRFSYEGAEFRRTPDLADDQAGRRVEGGRLADRARVRRAGPDRHRHQARRRRAGRAGRRRTRRSKSWRSPRASCAASAATTSTSGCGRAISAATATRQGVRGSACRSPNSTRSTACWSSAASCARTIRWSRSGCGRRRRRARRSRCCIRSTTTGCCASRTRRSSRRRSCRRTLAGIVVAAAQAPARPCPRS